MGWHPTRGCSQGLHSSPRGQVCLAPFAGRVQETDPAACARHHTALQPTGEDRTLGEMAKTARVPGRGGEAWAGGGHTMAITISITITVPVDLQGA